MAAPSHPGEKQGGESRFKYECLDSSPFKCRYQWLLAEELYFLKDLSGNWACQRVGEGVFR